jgi:hypothetical protein
VEADLSEVINALLQIFSNAQYTIDVCGNSKFLTKIFSFSVVDKVRLEVCKRKDVRLRYIFEITKENIHYCKGLMKAAEVRHLEEHEANFVTNENECLGFITMQYTIRIAISKKWWSNKGLCLM